MKNIRTFDQFVNENYLVNEAKWEVLGSIGDFQVFPDKEKGDHIILIIGKGGDQREYPVYLKKRDTADKLRDRYYHGRQINIKESVITEKVKEIEIGKTYKASKNFRSGSNSIDKGTEIEILDIGNNFAEVEVFDGPFGMGTKMEVKISDLEKYLVESVNESKANKEIHAQIDKLMTNMEVDKARELADKLPHFEKIKAHQRIRMIIAQEQ